MALTDDREPGFVSLADGVESAATSTAQVRFTALRGGVGVLRNGEAVAIGGPQQRRLLAALLAAKGAAVSADRLADTIWPDGAMPDGARRTVMSYVSRLRAAIGGDYVVTGAHGYQLVLGDAAYDADEFEERLAVARASAGAASIAAYDHALHLWSGRAFGDDGSEWWLSPVATRLEELRLVAYEERCERLIETGRHAEAVADLEGLIADQPLREQFIALEMRALYLSGRQAEALRTYRRFADYLAEETGLDPSEMLVDLEQKVLIGDPSLAPTNGVAVPGYELGDRIGEGAFGSVYRAVQPSLGRDVAVKAIRAELADDPRFVQRFETEAQLVARIEHPHVVPLYDFWRQPGAAFLVFRLLRGGSLADRISSGPLPLAEVSRIVVEIGGALVAAHALGIVHRDVKPANVLFDESGNSYLADFGIAQGAGEVVEVALRSAGSPLYASPEQARDGLAGQASDQYSLAVVAWEALAGLAPFAGSTATEVVRNKLTQTLPALSFVSDAYAALDVVLQKASAPVPVDRYRDMGEFVHAWVTACTGADVVRTTGSLPSGAAAARAAGTLASLSLGSVNPYKGLRAFREADAAEFCGRSGLVDALVERVDADPFVLVVGPSGSGKSSLVHAGAVPTWRHRDALVVSMVPSADPFVELEAALRRVATAEVGDIGSRLLEPDGLGDIAADIATGDSPLVIVIDQFEELWTLVPSDAVRDRFAATIAATLAGGHDIRIVATLRADLYDRPLQHPVFGPIVRDSTFAVTPMTSNELHDAIALPAERAGVRFEPGLVSTMVGDVVTRPGALPLLQFALTELFEQRVNGVVTADAYDTLGGIGGAIARRAEQLYDETPTRNRDEVRRLFTQLVTPGDDNDDLRRRATRDELADIDPDVIASYLAHRLLVTDTHPVTREPVIEVAHEALLREWPRLVEWIDQDRDTIRLRRALHTAAHDWDAHGRDDAMVYRGSRLAAAQDATRLSSLTPTEHDFLQASHELDERERTETAQRAAQQARQNKRLRRLLTAAAILLVIALTAGVLAITQRNRADNQASAARAAQSEAEQANELATARGDAAQRSSDEAIAQRSAAEASRNEAVARGLAAQSVTALTAGQNDVALLIAVESARFADAAAPDSNAAAEAHDALIRALGDDPLLVGYLDGQAGLANHMEFSPDGRHVATVSDNGDIRVWDAETGQPHSTQPESLPFTPRGIAMSDSLLAVPDASDWSTRLWDLNAQTPWSWQPPRALDDSFEPGVLYGVSKVALSRDGLLARSFSVVGQGQNSTVEIWDTTAGVLVGGPVAVDGIVDAMGFSPDGTELAVNALSADWSTLDLQTIDTRTGTPGWRTVAHPGSTTGLGVGVTLLDRPFLSWVRYSSDGTQVSSILSRSTVGAIATFDAATGAPAPSNGVGRDRSVLAVSDDLELLVLGAGADGAGGTENPTEVVEASTGDVVGSFPTSFAPIQGRPAALRPDTTELVIQNTSGDLMIRDWVSVGAQPFATAPPAELTSAAIVQHGIDPGIDLAEPLRLHGVQYRPSDGEFPSRETLQPWSASPDGQVVIATESTIEIWDPDLGEFVRRLELPADCGIFSGQSLAFHGGDDDGTVVAGCRGSTLIAWDLGSPAPGPGWTLPKASAEMVSEVLLSPDGSRMLDNDGMGLRLTDARTGEVLALVPELDADNIVRFVFSPDGSVVAVVRWSGDIDLFRSEDLSLIRRVESSTGTVEDPALPDGYPALAISPDNGYVAAWHWKLGVEIWNVESGESLAVIDGRRDYRPRAPGDRESTFNVGGLAGYDSVRFPAIALDFADEGSALSLAVRQNFLSEDGSAYGRRLDTVWSLGDDDLIAAACGIVDRDLTASEWAQYVGADVPYRATCSSD
jgi:DNA-binding SARP family transcriptional activator/WD40 repeat protein